MVIKKYQPCDLVIFGAKGDLARRKLLPSLYQLEKAGHIHDQTRIIGVGRAELDRTGYAKLVYKALEDFMGEIIEESLWMKLKNRLYFCNLDINHISQFFKLGELLNQRVRVTVNYFAMPPNTFGDICKGLGIAKLNNQPTRVVMEKPLGISLDTSQEINKKVGEFFEENQVFRIDHYLAKETVLNLLALRFANSIFINNWDNRSIDHVQITVAEQVGIEGRWGYFNQVGQMRDMIQNHLLQILTIIAMSPPSNLSADSIRDEKVKILQSLRRIDKNNIRQKTVRGQYTRGLIQNKMVLGYLEEDGATQNSKTETFVAIRVDIDNWRWAGVPFYLRSGKRLHTKCSEVVVYFKNPAMNLFKDSYKTLPANKLTIRLQPDEGVDIEILNKIPGLNHKHKLQLTKLDLSYSETFQQSHLVDAYERLLLESMRGIQALFVRRDEVDAAWSWVDSIINAWDIVTLETYPAGSCGPIGSMQMISRDGRFWNNSK
ncbi:glucose-6-phosphate 1-dehydrogenase [Candidatus Ishikawaella capsulata Mpkobe]|uniref:Glucose-6-phosphate 1-dehydrogenase n=1 Tax=Candidatus Ishikawaella capsulata Mpkobe TaxID=476281 RepID=C5WCN1_9ENTR|nr:glucose-6-phosphate dehydrogenase [Candidatus Ishikawaella capsulata]BAH83087.1 glucose-6-phosphate 1-dehydrogenase [Candidatus Ishikawaella capsulata Mpkobe]